jgi:hypothetical protein
MPSLVTLPPASNGRQSFKPTEAEIKDWLDMLGKVKGGDDWIVSDQSFNNRQAASRYGKLYEDAIKEADPKADVSRRAYETDEEGVFRFALRLAA